MRELKHGRQPAAALVSHSTLTKRLADVTQQGVKLRSLVRAMAPLVCERTVFVILAGRGRATPTALCAWNVLGEVVAVDRRERVVGVILTEPNLDLVEGVLRRLAQEGPAARAFALARLQQLENIHSGFGVAALPGTTQELQP